MAQFLFSTPREDKLVFLLRPRILILKVAKLFRETFFRGVELVRVNDIQKQIQNGVGMI